MHAAYPYQPLQRHHMYPERGDGGTETIWKGKGEKGLEEEGETAWYLPCLRRRKGEEEEQKEWLKDEETGRGFGLHRHLRLLTYECNVKRRRPRYFQPF